MGTQASPTTGAGSPSDAANVVLFQVAGKSFAIDLTQVERIIDYREPTKTPRRPPHVDGVLEDQGRYVPVVNLRKRLGVSDVGPAHPAVLLIADAGPDPLVGLVVDQVLRILSLPAEGVLAPPPRVFGIRAEYIRGVANTGGRPLVWLDVTKLLTTADAITLLA